MVKHQKRFPSRFPTDVGFYFKLSACKIWQHLVVGIPMTPLHPFQDDFQAAIKTKHNCRQFYEDEVTVNVTTADYV